MVALGAWRRDNAARVAELWGEGYTITQIAAMTGARHRGDVSKLISLMELPKRGGRQGSKAPLRIPHNLGKKTNTWRMQQKAAAKNLKQVRKFLEANLGAQPKEVAYALGMSWDQARRAVRKIRSEWEKRWAQQAVRRQRDTRLSMFELRNAPADDKRRRAA